MTNSESSTNIPVHLGIIPDGNRRWAKEQGLPSLEGHRRGLDVAREISIAAFERGVEYFTMYAFSTENWRRATDEVGYLMNLFYTFLKDEYAELESRDVRFRLIGQRDNLAPKLIKVIDELEARTAHCTKGTLSLCLNYGGEQELADAAASLIREGAPANTVTPEVLKQHLYAPEIPSVDLVIRTSGEHRTSGFMLWRAAYAEFYFVEKNWPEFSVDDLDAAIADYGQRTRRFGR